MVPGAGCLLRWCSLLRAAAVDCELHGHGLFVSEQSVGVCSAWVETGGEDHGCPLLLLLQL